LPIVPGFRYDLFVSYAHANDIPWRAGATGWVGEFVQTLKSAIAEVNRDFTIWFDPSLRTGEDFNAAIAEAISESAVFLSVLSPAYDDSAYCKQEAVQFRNGHPAFGMLVGTLSRMQGIVLEVIAKEHWPPELRTTSPFCFCNDSTPRFYKPAQPDESHPYVKGLWKTRDSILAVLDEMRRRREGGTEIQNSYAQGLQNLPHIEAGEPAVFLAAVPDDLYVRRERLRSALQDPPEFRVENFPDSGQIPGLASISVHMFGIHAGQPAPGKDAHLSRLQLQTVLAANPARRPVVWIAPEVETEDADTRPHEEFLKGLLNHNGIELVRMGFEDLKEEIQKRMRPKNSPGRKVVRSRREDPIVHIWHQNISAAALAPLKRYLVAKSCAIAVFASAEPPRLQTKLAAADGLVVTYTAETKSWAEEVMSETFHLRWRDESPAAYAAVELPPRANGEFNFEHSRVFPVQTLAEGQFRGMDEFLERLD
jgi:hypothetical protein